jgi:glycosyltransferase involved in cell wall biosynthesis
MLFEACAELFAKGYDFDVVLTGFGTEHFDDACSNGEIPVESCRAFLREKQNLFRGRLKSLGYLERTEVETLYKRSTATILPSFFEGFGLALTEALETGATVICSDIPAHREQLTRYGCIDKVSLTPARDAMALATQMEKVLIASPRSPGAKCSPSIALEQWTWKHAASAYLESLAAVTAK